LSLSCCRLISAAKLPISRRDREFRGNLGEGLFDGGDDAWIAGRHIWGKTGQNSAIAADEEFFKVPEDAGWGVGGGEILRLQVTRDAVAEAGVVDDGIGCSGGELAVERVNFRPLDGDFGEKREGDGVVGGAELGDFLVGARFLRGEVVGREAEDDEAAVFVLLIELLESGVLRGEAAFGGDVHDEQDFAGIVGKAGGGTGESGQRDVGERGHAISLAILGNRCVPDDEDTQVRVLFYGFPKRLDKNVIATSRS